jgi:ATP-dependent helicase/nuclease subunit A
LPSFISDRDYVIKLQSILDAPYNNIREHLSAYTKLDLGRGVKKELQDSQVLFFKGIREKLAKDIRSVYEKYFSFDHDRVVDFSIKNARLNADTASILRSFDKALAEEKKKRGIIDFSDLERLCYSLLVQDGKPTSVAKEIAQSIDEIYIDEYQDTNELQDGIFAAISNPRNRFMVGDIKQSIYGFRGALPNIFSSYRDRFPIYDGNESDASTVFLSDNFRCDKPIIDYSNLIFDKLFTNTSSDLTYYPSDRLKFSKVVDKDDFHRVETVIVEDNDDDEERDSEADYVVSRINELIDVGYRPSDIVILLSSPSSDAERFENALKDINLPFYSDVKRSFFENAEILLMLCLLNCIDNPTRDIYLAGALKSPIFNFNLDELIEIRKERDDCSLYEAFIAYSERTESQKCKYFLEKLDSYRKFSRAQAVDKLIWHIYRDTSLLSLVYDNAESGKSRLRRANLMLLYEYARKFESSSFKGLNNFIAYLNDIISENEKFEDAKASSESDNVIRIMSIHQSKGLEFPVCFLCGCDKGFNYIDSRNDIVFTRKLGLSTRIRDDSGFIRYDTPIRSAVSLEITRNTIDEQMRVLYVALTRARERLIVTARAKDAPKFLDDVRLSSSYISNYSLSQSPSYIKWILTALYSSEYDDCCIIKTADSEFSNDSNESSDNEITKEADHASYQRLKEEIESRFGFKYKYSDSVDIPAKLSVSHLYPTILDDEEVAEEDVLTSMKERPSFLDCALAKASASEKGTATHVFMQFCDFRNAELNGAKQELSRLISGKFIAPHYSDLVYLERVDAFFRSAFYDRIKNAKRIHRETRFNISLSASDFTKDEQKKESLKDESILVQGVMDLIFLDKNDKFVLLDYKTDKIPYQIRNDLRAVKDFLSERHSLQLSYYKTACEKLFMRKVDEVYVYAFDIDKEIRLN